MEKSEVAERVKKVTKNILKIEGDIDDNSNFIFDLGADSLQSVQLVQHLKKSLMSNWMKMGR